MHNFVAQFSNTSALRTIDLRTSRITLSKMKEFYQFWGCFALRSIINRVDFRYNILLRPCSGWRNFYVIGRSFAYSDTTIEERISFNLCSVIDKRTSFLHLIHSCYIFIALYICTSVKENPLHAWSERNISNKRLSIIIAMWQMGIKASAATLYLLHKARPYCHATDLSN